MIHQRMTLGGDALATHLDRADRLGIDASDIVSAVLEGHAGDSSVNRILDDPLPADIKDRTDYQRELAQVTEMVVSAIRLGPPDRSGSQSAPFARAQMGASVGEEDLETLWLSTRGHWVISADTEVIVAFRLGVPLAVFRVEEWSQATGNRRRWARSGYAIRDGRQVRFVGGGAVDVQDATAEESAIAQVILGSRLWMPAGASNPVANLHRPS